MEDRLTSLGWRYVNSSCSCQGKAQWKKFVKENKQIQLYFKKNTFQYYDTNWTSEKPISEIEAYL